MQDGVVLCNLANRIVPNAVDSVHMDPGNQFLKMQNINAFLEVVPKMGVKSGDLFNADELYVNMHTRTLTRTRTRTAHPPAPHRTPSSTAPYAALTPLTL